MLRVIFVSLTALTASLWSALSRLMPFTDSRMSPTLCVGEVWCGDEIGQSEHKLKKKSYQIGRILKKDATPLLLLKMLT